MMLGPILRRMSSKRSLEHIDDERAEKVAFIKDISELEQEIHS